MSAITKDRLLTIKQWRETYGPGSNVVLPAEEAEELARIALASLEREQIRHEHAKWSDSTFGCVGPIGPLKHLSKEALEAAAEPDDLSEWADMQFLLWDAQRRAGISDAEINVAMEDKLKINMERQWPEPKDG
ncbi:dATP/dGTP pyrophosphohydrolase domain-containing protein, partial [Escherichia coli]